MQLPLPVIFALQKSINKLIELDHNLVSGLEATTGKVVCIHVKGFDTSIYLVMHESEIEILRFFDGVVDTTLSGTPFALASLKKNTQALFQGNVEITGNLQLGKHIKKLLASIDIDWEEQLSLIVGDTMAHNFGRMHQSAHKWFSRSETNFTLNLGDFLKEELSVVVSHTEVAGFCMEVDDLRTDVDRIEARMSLLERPVKDSH